MVTFLVQKQENKGLNRLFEFIIAICENYGDKLLQK